MKMTYLMMRLEWKVFISSKPCRLIVVPRQEFIKHMFGKLLFFFVFPKLGISYKVKKRSHPGTWLPSFRVFHWKNNMTVILNSVSLNWYCMVPLYFSRAAFTLCIPQPCFVLSSLSVTSLPVLSSISGRLEIVL